MKFTLRQFAEWSGGELQGDGNISFDYIVSDSRNCIENSLFIAIVGSNHNGNNFIGEATQNGAVASLVSDKERLGSLPGIICKDTITALCKIAKHYRESTNIPWIAITGSNGKTTTRELLNCTLQQKGIVGCSLKNYNNRIGLPLSILSTPQDSWAGIIEVGTNAHGEIEELSEILKPTIGIITSIGSTHLAGLNSVQGVAEEKSKLFEFITHDGLAIYPNDCQYCNIIESKITCNKKTFSTNDNCQSDIFATEIKNSENKISFNAWNTKFDIPISGEHNIGNILSTIIAADYLGITPEETAKSLISFKRVNGRLNTLKKNKLTVIDDTYNSNPDSMCAAVKHLCKIPAKRRVCILGYMGELGDHSEKLHRECGYMIARCGIDLLISVGQDTVALAESASTRSAGCKVHYFPTVTAVMPKLKKYINNDDTILVKGSRNAKMERIVNIILNMFD